MGKTRFHCHLDEALFALVILAGGIVSAVLDVQAISSAMATGRYGLAPLATLAPVPQPAPAAASTPRRSEHTVLARLMP